MPGMYMKLIHGGWFCFFLDCDGFQTPWWPHGGNYAAPMQFVGDGWRIQIPVDTWVCVRVPALLIIEEYYMLFVCVINDILYLKLLWMKSNQV